MVHVSHRWYYMPMVYAVYCAAAVLALLFVGKREI